MKTVIQCFECDADFTVKHDMDKRTYTILYCPFCGCDLKSTSEQYEDETEEKFEDIDGYDEPYDDED